jgi:SAM-dependent methyltransferase
MKRCLACGARHDAEDWTCAACGESPPLVDGIRRFGAGAGTASAADADYIVDQLAAAEPWHFWFQSRRRLVLAAIRRYYPKARRLLDVGCGTGFVLSGIRDEDPSILLSGCEVDADMLRTARRRVPDAHLFEATAEGLPYVEEFDVILALDVLEHIDRDVEALGSMLQALKPGGGLIVSVPQHPALWSAVDDFSHHRRRYTRGELREKVQRAGFEVRRITSMFAVTLPLQVGSRLVNRRRAEFDPTAELRLSRPVNTLLAAAMRVESAVISTGLSLPAGGSLLAVSERRPA